MSYLRVIPRDLFNEANLLKCYGRLYILTEGNRIAHFSTDCLDVFEVDQREEDGYTFIRDLEFIIGEHHYRLVRPLNSREGWPLYAEQIGNPDFEQVAVFNKDGKLSAEFHYLIAMEERTQA
jgi:hypothetical protein